MSRCLFGCSSVPCTAAGEPHSAVQGKELSQTVVGPSRQPAVDARAADQAQFRAVRSLVRQPGSGEQRSASRPSLGDEGAGKTEAEGPARAPAPSSKCTDLREMIAALRSAHDASHRHRQRERLPLERSPGALTPRPVRGSRRHGGTPSSRKRTEHKKRRCVPIVGVPPASAAGPSSPWCTADGLRVLSTGPPDVSEVFRARSKKRG